MTPARSGQYFLLGVIALVALVAYFIARPFLAPLALAAVFAVVLQPVYGRVLRLVPRWPGAASVLTVLFGVLVILLPLVIVGAQIVSEARDVYASLVTGEGRLVIQETLLAFESVVGAYIPQTQQFVENFSANVSTYAQSALRWLIQNSGAAVAGVATTLLSLFVFVIALFYLLKDGAHFRDIVVRFSPLRDAYDERVFERLHVAINSVVRGSLLIALIQGVASTIGFTIFGIPNAVLWGSVAALAALLPGIGTSVVFLPVIIYSLVTGNVFAAVGLTVWGATAVGLVDNFLTPRLIGSGIQLHPLLVMISVLGGLIFFGPVGIFLGPLTLSLLFALLMIHADIARNGA